MKRMIRFFSKQKKVSEETIAAIKAAEDETAKGIDAAIHTLSEQ